MTHFETGNGSCSLLRFEAGTSSSPENWLTFLQQVETEGGALPPFVVEELEAYLSRGIHAAGAVELECEDCIVGAKAHEEGELVPDLADLQPAIDRYHARIGAHVCQVWKLPPLIAGAVAHHHEPRIGAHVCQVWKLPPLIAGAVAHHHESEASSDPAQMATVVAVADRLLGHAGIGCDRREVDPMGEPLFYRLNLTPLQVNELLDLALGMTPEAA